MMSKTGTILKAFRSPKTWDFMTGVTNQNEAPAEAPCYFCQKSDEQGEGPKERPGGRLWEAVLAPKTGPRAMLEGCERDIKKEYEKVRARTH